LENFQGTVLVISHDRYLLGRIVMRIAALDEGVLVSSPGNHADCEAARVACCRDHRSCGTRGHKEASEEIVSEPLCFHL